MISLKLFTQIKPQHPDTASHTSPHYARHMASVWVTDNPLNSSTYLKVAVPNWWTSWLPVATIMRKTLGSNQHCKYNYFNFSLYSSPFDILFFCSIDNLVSP